MISIIPVANGSRLGPRGGDNLLCNFSHGTVQSLLLLSNFQHFSVIHLTAYKVFVHCAFHILNIVLILILPDNCLAVTQMYIQDRT